MSDTPDPGLTIEELQQAAAERDVAAAELAKARRELAFSKAGIDTDTPVGAMFFKGYEGELTKDAILEQAIAVGALKLPEPPPAEPPPDNSEADTRLGLGSGDTPGVGQQTDVDPIEAGFQAFRDDMEKAGNTRERASAHFFSRVIDAAAKGDPRAIHNPAQWRELANQE